MERKFGQRAIVACLVAGYGLLIAAWVLANPPGSAPDEPAHYVRAIAAGEGDLLGRRVSDAEMRDLMPEGPEIRAAILSSPLAAGLARRFEIPARLAPGNFGCTAFRGRLDAACSGAVAPAGQGRMAIVSYLATYQPLVYPLPGAAMLLAATPAEAMLAGRAALGLWALAFLALATWLAVTRSGALAASAGVAVAATPMFVFAAASLGSSGVEIASGLCLWSALLAAARDGKLSPGLAAVIGASGGVLGAIRPFSPLWVILIAASVSVHAGRAVVGGVIRRSPAPSLGAALGVGLGTAAGLAWQVAVQPRVAGRPVAWFDEFWRSLADSVHPWSQEIGIFGWLDTAGPPVLYLAWYAMIAGLLALAVGGSDRRGRRSMLAVAGVAALLPALMNAAIAVPAGGAVQGRWLLPFTAGVAFLCARAVSAGRRRFSWARPVLGAAPALAALLQAVAFWSNAHRYAVGAGGPLLFMSHARWTPISGWWLPVGLCAAGCMLLLATSILLVAGNRRSAEFEPRRLGVVAPLIGV